MQEHSLSFETDQATWLHLPEPGLRDSWKRKDEYPDLMEGTYFWLNGDPILDTREEIAQWPTGYIAIHNPWLRKRSAFLSDIFAGKILAVLGADGSPDRAITFPEAENEWWIQEKTYLEAWRYLGKNTMTMCARIWIAQKIIPDTVYQLTKKWTGKIAITERDIQRPSIFYFFGLRPRL